MMKKLGLLLSFMSAGLLQAMDNTNYSSLNGQDITGLGKNATQVNNYEQQMAEMMEAMRLAVGAKNEKTFGSGFKKGFLNSKIDVVSEEEGVSFFYDEKTNTEWICGEQRFSRLVINAPTKNHVFFGKFSSDSDIDVKAKNLIIIGSLLSVNNMELKTSNDFFNAGSITAKNLNILSGASIYSGLNDEAIARIQALGIDMSFRDAEHKFLKVVKPSRD